MEEKKSISLHPGLAAVLDLVFSLILLWWLKRIGAQIGAWALLGLWFIARIIWWGFLLRLMYVPTPLRRWRHLAALFLFNCGLAIFLIFVDWRPAWYIVAAIFMIFPALSFWFVPDRPEELSLAFKPQRRTRFFLSVWGVAGLWNGVTAATIFQIFNRPWEWIAVVAATIVTIAVSVWWWLEYGIAYSRRVAAAGVIIGTVMVETGYVILFWPLGYLASGFFITWVWYIVWLLLRFHLSTEGIRRKRQAFFLIGNASLMALFLALIARWR